MPGGPYNWMDQPPSVNQVLGVIWLAHLLYPDVFQYDMAAKTRQFYELFYHCELADAQVEALLAGSTFAK